MSKYGKKIIFDMETRTTREEELTPEEVAEREQADIEHEKMLAEAAKVQYLQDRKRDKDWPTIEQKADALWSKDQSQIDAINARIKDIEAKYPAPQGDS